MIRFPANLAFALALLLLAGSLSAPARVYQRSGFAHRGYVAPEQLGWAPAYSTRIQLNGGGGSLEVLESRLALLPSIDLLNHAYQRMPARAFFYPAGSSAWGVVFVNGHVIRIFAFQLDSDRQTLVMRFDQTEEEFEASMQVPEAHAMQRIPGHAGLRPTCYAADEGTGLAMQIGRISLGMDDAYFYYAKAMKAEGWAPAMPVPSHRSEPSGFMMYARGRELCLVSVQSAGQTRESVLTLIHKKLDSRKVY